MCSTPTNGAGWGGGPTFGEEAGLGPRRGRSNVEEGTVLGKGTPVFGGARGRGPLVRVNTPDDVLRLLDDGAVGIVAVVPAAGASCLAPIQEYGGQGRPATDQFILFDEIQRAVAPLPFVAINTVGPTIMAFGSDEQKAFFLPRILRGELHFAIGYTELEAGTDLASLRTRAVRDGDEYVVNGNKVFTSGANFADYIWLACRTDADAPKHKGISILLVPTSSPGFKATPITTVGGVQTTATFYDDLRVPVGNRVGAENEGWRMITTQLNHERVGLAAIGGLAHRLGDDVPAWTRETESGQGEGRAGG